MPIQSNNVFKKQSSAPVILLIILILILLAGDVFFAMKYFSQQKQLNQTQTSSQEQINAKVLDFTRLFISQVLQAQTEVDFEARLQLENAVRGLDDAEILAQWKKFIESSTEQEAQNEVKNLLEMLVSKIRVE